MLDPGLTPLRGGLRISHTVLDPGLLSRAHRDLVHPYPIRGRSLEGSPGDSTHLYRVRVKPLDISVRLAPFIARLQESRGTRLHLVVVISDLGVVSFIKVIKRL